MPGAWPTDFVGCVLGSEPAAILVLRFNLQVTTWVSGKGIPSITGPDITIIPDIVAGIQPLKASEWQQLSLGGRVSDWRKMYTEEEIVSGQGAGTPGPESRLPDLILFEGQTYEAVQVNEYRAVYPHWRTILRRRQETGGEVAV